MHCELIPRSLWCPPPLPEDDFLLLTRTVLSPGRAPLSSWEQTRDGVVPQQRGCWKLPTCGEGCFIQQSFPLFGVPPGGSRVPRNTSNPSLLFQNREWKIEVCPTGMVTLFEIPKGRFSLPLFYNQIEFAEAVRPCGHPWDCRVA